MIQRRVNHSTKNRISVSFGENPLKLFIEFPIPGSRSIVSNQDNCNNATSMKNCQH